MNNPSLISFIYNLVDSMYLFLQLNLKVIYFLKIPTMPEILKRIELNFNCEKVPILT